MSHQISCLVLFFLWSSTALFSQQTEEFQLSTHMLDLSKGEPAAQVPVTLYRWDTSRAEWVIHIRSVTGENGRVGDLLPTGRDNEGVYKLRFETRAYFTDQGLTSIYPYVEVVFEIRGKGHYHIPITMSANGYSTYRGN